MSTVPTDEHDEQIDDQNSPLDAEPDEGAAHDDEPDAVATPTAPDLDPDIEQEIKKVIVEEEPAKVKMLPEQLIKQELKPDDLFDDGSI